MYYVYFLRSKKNPNWLYVGYTNNLKRRLGEHNAGKNTSTKPYIPFELVSYIAAATESKAKELETYFKAGSGKAILKKRIVTDEAIA